MADIFAPLFGGIFQGGGGPPPPTPTPFDPATLTYNSATTRRFWWDRAQGVFMNGGVPAGTGDPVSQFVSMYTDAQATYNHDLYSGSAMVLTADTVDVQSNPLYLKSLSKPFNPGAFYPKSVGFSVGALVSLSSLTGVNMCLGAEDHVPSVLGLFLDDSTTPGVVVASIRGDSGAPLTYDASSALAGAAVVPVMMSVQPDAGGACPCDLYVGSDTPVASGVVQFDGQVTRDFLNCIMSAPAYMGSRFFLAQGFGQADMANLRNFLLYGAP